MSTPKPSEAVYMFVAWITTRDEEITAGASSDCSAWADLVDEFCKVNNLEEPDCKYPGLRHPPRKT